MDQKNLVHLLNYLINPSCEHFNIGVNIDKNIYAVYSDNKSWNYLNLGILKK